MFAYPLSDPCLSGILGDPEVEKMFGSASVLERMLKFEAALAKALFTENEISQSAYNEIADRIRDLELDTELIAAATERDGVSVPELVRQVRDVLPLACKDAFHRGATSQDVIDSALTLTLLEFNDVAEVRLREASKLLVQLRNRHGGQRLIARTRMQRAGSLLVADRITVWLNSVDRVISDLTEVRKRVAILQFAGPVGDRSALPVTNPDRMAKLLAVELELTDTGASWQTDRGRLTDFASWLTSVTGALGKVGMDICLMAQNEEIVYAGGGKSSSLTDKNNPVGAEILVAIARFNAVLVSGMHHSLIHEQERSGSSWTLEWMILPQMCLATAVALRTMIRTVGSIRGFRCSAT